MESYLPVLIGSTALVHYGFDLEPNDIDLIVSESQAKEICFQATEKKGLMCFFGSDKVDLIVPNEFDVNYMVWDYVNRDKNKNQVTPDRFAVTPDPIGANRFAVTLFGKITVIICPLEILYIIKKSHIHRILPLTQNKFQDIEIWYRHVAMYDWMRQKLGYNKMDLMIYGEDKYGEPLGPVSVDSVDSVEENFYRVLFDIGFKEVNRRVGDTLISMEKSNDDFFADNVTRFIEHDDLHKLIALKERGVETVLYDDFKEDLNAANLSKKIFINADANKRNQCLYEEIMVLLLERKIIPEMVHCNVEARIPVTPYDKNKMYDNLKEIVAHFATNLCGQNHSWLRQYVIDHIHLLVNLDAYDFDALFKLSIQITKADSIESNIKEHNLVSMLDLMQTHKLDLSQLPPIGTYTHSKLVEIGNGSLIFAFKGVRSTDLKTTKDVIFYSELNYEQYQKYIDMVSNGLVIFHKPKHGDSIREIWFYNIDKNFGLIIKESSWSKKLVMTIFYCKISMSKKYTVQINGEYYQLDSLDTPNTFEQSFTKRYKTFYYYSTSCTENSGKSFGGKNNYLSSYGSAPASLGLLFEKIARYNLNLKRDLHGQCGESELSDDSYTGSGGGYDY